MKDSFEFTNRRGCIIVTPGAANELLHTVEAAETGYINNYVRARVGKDAFSGAEFERMGELLRNTKAFFDANPSVDSVALWFDTAEIRAFVQAVYFWWLDLDWKMELAKEMPEWDANIEKWKGVVS